MNLQFLKTLNILKWANTSVLHTGMQPYRAFGAAEGHQRADRASREAVGSAGQSLCVRIQLLTCRRECGSLSPQS